MDSVSPFDIWWRIFEAKFTEGFMLNRRGFLKNIMGAGLALSCHPVYAGIGNEDAVPERINILASEGCEHVSERYTFENFIVGSSNRFAYESAVGLCEASSTACNLVFINGDTGMGKTHLLHAIRNQIMSANTHKKVFYTSAELFCREFADAVESDTLGKFRTTYRKVNLFLLDDINKMSWKERAQEELLETFDILERKCTQIVVAGNVSKETIGLDERFKSRLFSGLTSTVHRPDFETRLAVLLKKGELSGDILPSDIEIRMKLLLRISEAKHIDMQDDVALFIGQHVKVKEMESYFSDLANFLRLTGQEATIDNAAGVFNQQREAA